MSGATGMCTVCTRAPSCRMSSAALQAEAEEQRRLVDSLPEGPEKEAAKAKLRRLQPACLPFYEKF